MIECSQSLLWFHAKAVTLPPAEKNSNQPKSFQLKGVLVLYMIVNQKKKKKKENVLDHTEEQTDFYLPCCVRPGLLRVSAAVRQVLRQQVHISGRSAEMLPILLRDAVWRH